MNPSPKGYEMIGIVSGLVGLATISAVLRIVARVKRHADIGIDDYLCIAAVILMFGMLAELVLWCTIGGNSYHQHELKAGTMEIFQKIFLSNQFTYFVLTPAVKTSITCFYRRLFTTRLFLRVTFALNCLMVAWAAGIFLACALQCRPLRGYWDTTIDSVCFDGNKFFIVNQAFNVVMDFIILGLPIPMIWRLHRSWQDKIALYSVFALGGFVCFASIYRIVVLFYIDPNDTTYTVYQATLWTHVEPSIGIVCSCLPTIRGLFPRFSRSTDRQSKQSVSSSQHLASNTWQKPATSHTSRNVWSDENLLQERSEGSQNRDNPGICLSNITVRTEIEVARDSGLKTIRETTQ